MRDEQRTPVQISSVAVASGFLKSWSAFDVTSGSGRWSAATSRSQLRAGDRHGGIHFAVNGHRGERLPQEREREPATTLSTVPEFGAFPRERR
jgi:hypothetical protein